MPLSVFFDYLQENSSYRAESFLKDAEFNSASIYATCKKSKGLVQFLDNET